MKNVLMNNMKLLKYIIFKNHYCYKYSFDYLVLFLLFLLFF